jgi:hypothetical protein
MPMMKSEKYKKHRASKYEFPTVKTLCGEKPARKAIEQCLGRQLHPDTVTRHTRSQWVFCEPKEVPA